MPAATCGSGSVSESLHHCKDHIGSWISYQTARRDGTTHIVMSPLEFMQRLAAPVPWPWLHLIRLHRVLAPNVELRALVVPAGPQEATGESELAATESSCAHGRPVRISWPRLLKRVFEIDLEHCPNCGGDRRLLDAELIRLGGR